jgi:GTPase
MSGSTAKKLSRPSQSVVSPALWDLPSVVIMGRPNVGKSTLLNRIVGKRVAIVDDAPGVTRDTTEHFVQWAGQPFRLLDTGGLMFEPERRELTELFDRQVVPLVNDQVEHACRHASVVVFLVDGQTGVLDEDVEIRNWLHRMGCVVLLAVNKLDQPQDLWRIHDYYALLTPPPHTLNIPAQEQPLALSALQGTAGVGDLLDAVVRMLHVVAAAGWRSAAGHAPELDVLEGDRPLRFTFAGRPNVGKSSMINALLGSERVIVSEVSGTTRDAIEVPMTVDGKPFVLVDTAGVRRKGKVDYGIEMFSVDRTIEAMRRSDVVVQLIDAEEGFTGQDIRITNKIFHELQRPLVLVVNKWDLVPEKNASTINRFREKYQYDVPFLKDVEIVFLSAQKPKGLHRLLEAADQAFENSSRRLKTSVVNQVIQEAISFNPPPAQRSKLPKIYYATQVSTNPPTFVVFVNSPSYFREDYRRYLERQFRERFVLTGSPVVIEWKARPKKEAIR